MDHWMIACVCTHVDEVGTDGVKSRTSVKDFDAIGVCGTGPYVTDESKMASWGESVDWTIRLLEKLQSPRFCTLQDVRHARCSDGSAKLVHEQKLSPKSLELRLKRAREYGNDPLRLEFDQ
mmetsp:Transcript_4687/g.6088  ORF Transcript_4687/g.6088 Transcript_4687/m.6088 type:complete len:121 (+) Transcript_4687:64-426(+)